MRLLSNNQELLEQINFFHPDAIGLSILTSEAETAEKTIQFINKNFPTAKIIVGGPHITVLPKSFVKIPGVFASVIGEGEQTILNLISAIETGSSLSPIRGIVYKKGKKIVINLPSLPIHHLDNLPFADRSIYNSAGWNSHAHTLFFPMKYPLANIIVSRGCPGRCTMCQPTLDKIFGRPARFRSPHNVIAEIRQLIKQQHIQSLIFWDDTLTANISWLKQFCQLMNTNHIHLDWWCYSRVNNINQTVISLMKQAGCKMICFGIESGSQRVLNEVMRKGTTVKQNIQAINLCHRNGILVNANVMIGSPTETLNEVKMTDQLLSVTQPDITWASVTSPLPGTYLGDQAKREGLITVSRWSELTRGQIGKLKMKTCLSNHDIVQYQTKWHQTRFRPSLIVKKYYLQACISLAICHLQQHHPERIISDFIFGPLIEIARRFYWRYFFPLSTRLFHYS